MKYLINKSTLLIGLLSIVFFSCEEDRNDGLDITTIPELSRGGFIRFPDGELPPPTISFADPETAGITYNLEDYNGNAESYTLDLEASIGGADYLLTDFITVTSFPNSIDISVPDVATRLGLTIDDVTFGDEFNFVARVTTTDGREFIGTVPALNDDGTIAAGNTENQLLTNPESYNSAMAFGFILACPSVEIAEFEGTYDVEFHRFDAFFAGAQATRTVELGPDANQITIVGGAVIQQAGVDDLVLNINPVTGEVTYGGSTEAVHFIVAAGPATYASVSGLAFSCIGVIDIQINSGGFIPNFLTISKQ